MQEYRDKPRPAVIGLLNEVAYIERVLTLLGRPPEYIEQKIEEHTKRRSSELARDRYRREATSKPRV